MKTDAPDRGTATQEITADICVIGGGSGGLSVAAGAVQMGASTVLFERGLMGGDCLNYGCVPSKALLAAGHAAAAAR
ncbi:MAG: FAD-dependent oxidoreductase, partial [Henriciella sp.]